MKKHPSAFTLIELLVALAIAFSLAAVSVPVIGALVRDVRMNNAISRLKVGLQQTQATLADYQLNDRTETFPAIPNAKFTGTALLVRWDDTLQEYDLSYLLSNQGATQSKDASDWLALVPDPAPSTAPGAPPSYCLGYSVFQEIEPIQLGPGIRVAGLRANRAKPSKLELLGYASGNPCCSSFAICANPTGANIQPAQQIYANLQQAPPLGGDGPWNIWSTAFYDAPGATTGAYAGAYKAPVKDDFTAGVGEGFLTSLPLVIVYRDDDLPLSGNSPGGAPWRIDNAAGVPSLNPAVDPNDLLAVTKGRLVFLQTQGGTPMDF